MIPSTAAPAANGVQPGDVPPRKVLRTRRSSEQRWFSAWDQLFLAYAPYIAPDVKSDNPFRGRRLLGVEHRRWPHRLHLAVCILFMAALLPLALGALPRDLIWIVFVAGAAVSMRPGWHSLRLARARSVRTKLFADLHRSRETGEPHPGVAAVLQDRRSYWKKPYVTFYSGSPTHGFYALDPVAQHLAFAALALIMSFSVLVQLRTGLVGIAVITAIAIALAAASTQRLRWVRMRTQRRIRSGQCPDCSYPLAELPDAIDPSLVGGAHTGPDRCPECGTHWPLVPPPALYDKHPSPVESVESEAMRHAPPPISEAAASDLPPSQAAPDPGVVGYWDRVPWVSMIGMSQARPRGNETWATFRRRIRINAYEQHARNASPSDLAMNQAPWASEGLLLHHRSRVAYWHSRFWKECTPPTTPLNIANMAILFCLVSLSMFALAFAWIFGLGWAAIVGALIVLGFVIQMRRSRRKREAFRGHFMHGRCPQCAYQIATPTTNAPPQAWMPIGPRICPECGAAWPLVPPPFPEGHGQS